MAGCYHDKQDFESDLNIEVAGESDILQGNKNLKNRKCTKNPGHEGFIPFKDLTLEHLPIEHRNRETLDIIKKKGSCVVKITVDKIKKGRSQRKREVGSGFVDKFKREYIIVTNNHVVKTEDELKHCTVEFHYNDDSKSGVLTSTGVKLLYTDPYRDFTFFTFDPVPDFLHQIYFDTSSIVIMYNNNETETEELLRKFTSFQKDVFSPLNLNSLKNHLMFILCEDGSYSYLKSSYFKFQPIPPNRPLFTAIKILFCYSISSIEIEIHIDEDDGNSKVITGEVVKFGDEFVVKISESIFQDEVKKCRLVWNGKVIGRGTRLYFKQVPVSEAYSANDLNIFRKLNIENISLVECHPKLRNMEAVQNTNSSIDMCCIGHPHGSSKMVTFGQELNRSHKKFDNQYRLIIQPKKDCQCQEVGCVTYSCKTCPGSSGSPVFLLGKWNDTRRNYSHFMGELEENKNIAWVPITPS